MVKVIINPYVIAEIEDDQSVLLRKDYLKQIITLSKQDIDKIYFEIHKIDSKQSNIKCNHEYSYAVFPAGKCKKCGAHD